MDIQMKYRLAVGTIATLIILALVIADSVN